MTVALTAGVKRYVYSGPGDYSFDFPFPLTSDVYVSHIDTDGVSSALEVTTDYTITANEDSDGGTITTINPTASGGVLSIERTLAFTQDTAYENEGPLQMSLIEAGFDRDVMLLQQMNELIDGLKVTISWKYEWTADTYYVVKDVVTEPGGSDWYQCLVENTSGDTFTSDVALGYWVKVLDFTTITQAVAEALEGVYPVPTAADEGKIPVVQADASMAYEDISAGITQNTADIATNAANIGSIETVVDLKAALSLFSKTGFSGIHSSGYAYSNGLLIQVVSGVLTSGSVDLVLTFPISFTTGFMPVYSQVDGSVSDETRMENVTLSSVSIVRDGGVSTRYNVIAIGV